MEREASSVRRALGSAAAIVLPFVATLATLVLLVPSRLEGGGGLRAWFARVGADQPLLLGIGLFVTFLAVTRYWLRRAAPDAQRAGTSRSFVVVAVGLIAVAWLVRARVAEIHRVEGASMAPTLNQGDRLVVNKLAYGLRVPLVGRVVGARKPARGDVVVFSAADAGGPDARVKRVLGVPGDVIDYRDGVPFINGWPVPSCDAGVFLAVSNGTALRARLVVEVLEGRAYLALRAPSDTAHVEAFRVPPGKVFVLGDDRGASYDSRGALGAVPLESLHGRVTRLAFASARDGRLDLLLPFTRLGPALRAGDVDVSYLEARIAACLEHPPASSTPPQPKP